MAAQNWNSIVARLGPERPVEAEPADEREKLVNEYIRAIAQPGCQYQLPRQEQELGEDGRPSTVTQPMHFEVLQVAHGHNRIHTMHAVESADDIALTADLAVEIQPHERWQQPDVEVLADANRVDIFHKASLYG